ncbi:MAG: IS630 family transposase [Deltaproteobacteria bacterium]|nr:IS630 family transposase [Deltaproteobacteria bacterium]MBW2082909.1 IS630 family transposase [Deltaproteobacteria bacterium]
MPRKSPYKIIQTGDQKIRLQAVARKYTSQYRAVMRAKIILLAAEVFSNKEIGQWPELPRQIVSKWRKRFFDQCLASLQGGPRRSRRGAFPPEIIVAVKARACQLPKQLGFPFFRFIHNQIARQAEKQGIVVSISGKTVWRWLSKHAIHPWSYRSWIWPRNPHFEQKAARIVHLYQGIWEGKPLDCHDFIISSDENTSIQTRRRLVPVDAPSAGRFGRVEHEYARMGAVGYLAAWDFWQAKSSSLCKDSTGTDSSHDLAELVMSHEPYRSVRRVFCVTDNGSSHRGQRFIDRLGRWYSKAIQVHTPIHASWLNQVEIYLSVLQHKVLTPNDFESLVKLENRILSFQAEYERVSRPFEWKFTRDDLKKFLSKFHEEQMLAA